MKAWLGSTLMVGLMEALGQISINGPFSYYKRKSEGTAPDCEQLGKEMCCKFFTNTPAGAYWLFSELLTGLAAEKRASLAIFKSVLLALSVGTGNVCGDIFAVRYEIHDKNTPTFWQQMTYNVI